MASQGADRLSQSDAIHAHSMPRALIPDFTSRATGSIRPMPHTDPVGAAAAARDLPMLDAAIADCFACPRLVAWREEQARRQGGPLPRRDRTGAGRCRASATRTRGSCSSGLAPAAHGGNRTGRVFTGDASGDFLWRAMHAVGLADRPVSRRADDGLTLETGPDRGRRPLRAAGQQADARGAGDLPAVPRPRDRAAPRAQRDRRPRAPSAGTPRCARSPPWATRRRSPGRGSRHGAETTIGPYRLHRHVPPEPAEHLHRPADAADARGRPRARAGRRLDLIAAVPRGGRHAGATRTGRDAEPAAALDCST